MMKRTIALIFFTIIGITAFSQAKAGGIKWYTIQEAEKLSQQSPRTIFIDTYTDWCGWCKKMDSDTFTDPVIADILNTRFYPVKFDAERKDEVTFLGQKFINDGKSGNAHQLAVALLQGQMGYPTVVFLNLKEGKAEVSPVSGYKPPKEMEALLSYFADKAYSNQTFEVFMQNFKGKIR